jgi:hypothetical protein
MLLLLLLVVVVPVGTGLSMALVVRMTGDDDNDDDCTFSSEAIQREEDDDGVGRFCTTGATAGTNPSDDMERIVVAVSTKRATEFEKGDVGCVIAILSCVR